MIIVTPLYYILNCLLIDKRLLLYVAALIINNCYAFVLKLPKVLHETIFACITSFVSVLKGLFTLSHSSKCCLAFRVLGAIEVLEIVWIACFCSSKVTPASCWCVNCIKFLTAKDLCGVKPLYITYLIDDLCSIRHLVFLLFQC